MLGIMLTAALTVSLILVVNYCKYADTAVLEIVGLVFDILALITTVFSNLKSGPKMGVLLIILVVTALLDWLYLYPRTCPPQIYQLAAEQLQEDSGGPEHSYKITVEANRTVNTVIIYENEARISEISDYKRSGGRRIFSDTVMLDHPLPPDSLKVEIRLPSGELLEVHAAKHIYPALHNAKPPDMQKPVRQKRAVVLRPQGSGNHTTLDTPLPADTFLPPPPDTPVPRPTPGPSSSPRATSTPPPDPTPSPTPPPAPSLSFTPSSFGTNLEPGQNIPLSCTVEPVGTEISSVHWSSSNSTAAAVDSTGRLDTVVHIRSSGQATISIKITTAYGAYSQELALAIP